jgi:hypothetical protein
MIRLIMFQTMAQDVRQSRAISITEWFGDYESWIKNPIGDTRNEYV